MKCYRFFSLGFLIICFIVAEMKLCSECLQKLLPALYPPPKLPRVEQFITEAAGQLWSSEDELQL